MARRVGFIGGGMMAEALISGLIKSGTSPDDISVSEPFPERLEFMVDTYKVQPRATNHEVCANSDIAVMAVKPQVLDKVLADLQKQAEADPNVSKCLLASIVAGKLLATFEQYLPDMRIARVMPNTPSLVGCGASVFVLNSKCTNEDAAHVEAVMTAVGIAEQVSDEYLLDAVTGLSGSGPAYVYLMIEAMSDGGVRMGLPRATATRLAAQTVLGAGTMVMETGKHPGALKDAVTSPGGTTIAGVHALEIG
eukprot:CAMPEP_0115108006 /NCGR_PEP_ID=MMETSP0227-20121206/37693_1 /TAXON_ID=89957 /ORGANISM="Polarella glacialis, Strain CCMP 1383" /LENGTH=250 /DNA_ID=CAMNT_0002506111 /DNA_START=11 /DNA_END=759 /DNA_ORIENTATION=-